MAIKRLNATAELVEPCCSELADTVLDIDDDGEGLTDLDRRDECLGVVFVGFSPRVSRPKGFPGGELEILLLDLLRNGFAAGFVVGLDAW